MCDYITNIIYKNATSITRNAGAGAGAIGNSYTSDGSYVTSVEQAGDFRRTEIVFNYTNINLTGLSPQYLQIDFVGKRPFSGAGDPANDFINMYIYNYNVSQYVFLTQVFNYTSTDIEINHLITANVTRYVSANGTLSLLLNDTINSTTDTQSTTMSIDQLVIDITTFIANSSINTVAGGGELNVRNRSAQYGCNLTQALAYLAQINLTTNQTLVSIGNLSFTASMNGSDVAGYVWNATNRNLTYYPAQVDLTNYTQVAQSVWQYAGTPSSILLSNIAQSVWNYAARYIHGEIL
jgi:hypothetical protein